MNREIKFRAWDEQACRMSQSFYPLKGEQAYIYDEPINQGYSTFMQFTGLLDRNGKEIYEGDIVSWNNNIQKGNSEIVFYDGCFRLRDYPDEDYNKLETGHRVSIIGNIYENPELLK